MKELYVVKLLAYEVSRADIKLWLTLGFQRVPEQGRGEEGY